MYYEKTVQKKKIIHLYMLLFLSLESGYQTILLQVITKSSIILSKGIFKIFINLITFITFTSTCTCTRILNIIIFGYTMFYWIFTHTPAFINTSFLVWIILSTITRTFTVKWNIFCLCLWLIYSCYHIKYM